VPFPRWDPLHDLLTLHERMNRLGGDSAPGWTPQVDVYETADRFVISAELPGLSRDDIRIDVQPDTIILRGERPSRRPDRGHYHRVERGHGAFARSFGLPQPIDVDAVTADFTDGVLSVLAPKLGAPPRRIQVR
jgi:HSP20 family protein